MGLITVGKEDRCESRCDILVGAVVGVLEAADVFFQELVLFWREGPGEEAFAEVVDGLG